MESTDTNESLEDKVLETLRKLEVFSGRHLHDDEIPIWKDRLMKYPIWKLQRIDEYAGPLSHQVFKFLDELRPLSSPTKEPSFVNYEPNREFAREITKSINKMLAFMGDPAMMTIEGLEKKWRIENEEIERMRRLFPRSQAVIDWQEARHRQQKEKRELLAKIKETLNDKQSNDLRDTDSGPAVQGPAERDTTGVIFNRVQQVHKGRSRK